LNKTLPRYGFGTFHLSKHGFKGGSLHHSVKTLETALSLGVTFFDTAPVYGFGMAERILGEMLRPLRESVLLATKCGLIAEEGRVRHDLSYDSILRECESSLDRLDTSYIDLYQVHWPDPQTPIEMTCRALTRLRDEKLIRLIGVSNFSLDLIREFSDHLPLFSVQNHFSLLHCNDRESLIPWCAANDIHYIAYNVLEQGALTPSIAQDYKPGKHDLRKMNSIFNSQENLTAALRYRDSISGNPVEEALTFALSCRGVSSILVSTANPEHLLRNLNVASEIK